MKLPLIWWKGLKCVIFCRLIGFESRWCKLKPPTSLVIPALTQYSDIVSDIPSGSIYGIYILNSIYLTVFLAYTLTFYLTFFLAYDHLPKIVDTNLVPVVDN
jgi:hypothetical protein